MQTTVYIPAQRWTRMPDGHQWRDCTIIAFVGVAGTDTSGEPWSATQAVAMWPTGELFEDRVGAFRVEPDVDLTPAEVFGEQLIEDAARGLQAHAEAAAASNARLRRQHR